MPNSIFFDAEIRASLLNFSNDDGDKTTNIEVVRGWRKNGRNVYATIEVYNEKPSTIRIQNLSVSKARGNILVSTELGLRYRLNFKKVKDRYVKRHQFKVDGELREDVCTLDDVSKKLAEGHKVNVFYYQDPSTSVTSEYIVEVNSKGNWVKSCKDITYWFSS
jgi:hypothetical protein